MSTGRVLWILWCCAWAALWLLAAAWEWPRHACGMYQVVNPGCMYQVTNGSAWGATGLGALAAVSLAAIVLPVGREKMMRPFTRRIPVAVPGCYSGPELQHLWITQGGNPRHARVAAAIALAESGGYPNAICVSDGRIGLWQVPYWTHCRSPETNVSMAIRISSNGEDWSQFPGYTNGTYRNFMKDAGPDPLRDAPRAGQDRA